MEGLGRKNNVSLGREIDLLIWKFNDLETE